MMRFLLTLPALLVLAACAANPIYEDATRLAEAGRPEEAVARLERLVKENPRNAEYRAALIRERDRAVAQRLFAGDVHLRAGRLSEAEREFLAAAALDTDAMRSTSRLSAVALARKQQAALREAEALLKAGKLDLAEARTRDVLADSPNHGPGRELLRRVLEAGMAADPAPRLKAPFRKPVTLEFRDAPIRTVFDMLSRTSGINFVFDRDVKQDQKLSVFLRNTTLEDALELILTTHGLDRKVLNENSVLVYPNTPAKQKDYRELVVRSFYLSNADVKQAAVMVKTLTRAQDVFIDEKLNLMVMRDTPEVVRMADQLVRTLDLAEPEVMLEVEVLELSRTRLQDLGINWPGSVSLGARGVSTTGTTTATTSTQPIDGPMVFSIANPALTMNLRATVGRSTLLANPRIRVKNREKAKIHIGDKVPVFTSTAVANAGVASSVTYLDVGLKLDVEPQVYLNDDVSIKVSLEVSNIVKEVQANAGATVAYQIGTRNTTTVLQLRDGETQILAGLINDNDRRTSSRIPGLGDLPVLSRLFGSTNENKEKSEIVLLITPRVVRNITRPEGVMAELPVGTDTTPGRAPLRIARTEPGSLGVSPAGAGGNAGGRAAPEMPRATDAPFQIGLALPASVRLNDQFALTVLLPDVIELANGYVEIAFDPAVLRMMGGTPSEPGRVRLPVVGAGQSMEVTLQAIAESPGTQISVANAELVDASGFAVGVAPPPPATLAVRK
jgi:general secretion pathway protein D